jgi:mannan endo-1,4-beta-mannosidase
MEPIANWRSGGYYFIDAVYVTPAPLPPPHNVTKYLISPNPLPVAYALYYTLLAKYGSGDIFSGQADPTGVTWIEENIGETKTPAIIGLDMIDYSPTRVVSYFSSLRGIKLNRRQEYGANSTAVQDAIAFDARGGIVAFQWHWNAPA